MPKNEHLVLCGGLARLRKGGVPSLDLNLHGASPNVRLQIADPVDAVRRADGALFVTADHGNCELMRDPITREPHTAHTLNPVPAILVGGPAGATLANGRLGDIAPTLLGVLGEGEPREMTGRDLRGSGK